MRSGGWLDHKRPNPIPTPVDVSNSLIALQTRLAKNDLPPPPPPLPTILTPPPEKKKGGGGEEGRRKRASNHLQFVKNIAGDLASSTYLRFFASVSQRMRPLAPCYFNSALRNPRDPLTFVRFRSGLSFITEIDFETRLDCSWGLEMSNQSTGVIYL